jgi:hypothetical protein
MTGRNRTLRWIPAAAGLVIVIGGLWSAAWFYGAGIAERTIAGWKAREAKAGRVYNCASQTIGGFPFGIELHCDEAGAEFNANRPPVALKVGDMLVSAHVWQPTVLTAAFAGPLTAAAPDRPAAKVSARWRHAEVKLQGLPVAPERVAIRTEALQVSRGTGGDLFKADRLDLAGRLLSGSVQHDPVIEIVLRLGGGSASSWHPAAATPVDAEITAVLRGLKDFSPKPWPQRLRELQANGGRLEIVKARLQQRDTIAVAQGALRLSSFGRLDGELKLTIANLEQFLPTLGLDRMLSPDRASPGLNKTFNRLDRLLPGLGNMARQNAGPMIAAGAALMGEPTELEGQRAVTLPLRFDDGLVWLGPVRIGAVPPLY